MTMINNHSAKRNEATSAVSRFVEHSIEIFHLNSSLRMISLAFFHSLSTTPFSQPNQKYSFCGFAFFCSRLIQSKLNSNIKSAMGIFLFLTLWRNPFFFKKIIVALDSAEILHFSSCWTSENTQNVFSGVLSKACYILHQNVISFNEKKSGKA